MQEGDSVTEEDPSSDSDAGGRSASLSWTDIVATWCRSTFCLVPCTGLRSSEDPDHQMRIFAPLLSLLLLSSSFLLTTKHFLSSKNHQTDPNRAKCRRSCLNRRVVSLLIVVSCYQGPNRLARPSRPVSLAKIVFGVLEQKGKDSASCGLSCSCTRP